MFRRISGLTLIAAMVAISIASDCYDGTLALLQVIMTFASGAVDTVDYLVSIGTRNSSDPVGPDQYGYYAFDDTDSDYDLEISERVLTAATRYLMATAPSSKRAVLVFVIVFFFQTKKVNKLLFNINFNICLLKLKI